MAARKRPKPIRPKVKRPISEVSAPTGLDEILNLVPHARTHHMDSATALYSGLSIVRETMKRQLGIDPYRAKSPQHIEVALRLLAMLLEQSQSPSLVSSRSERVAGRHARSDEARRIELERLMRTHRGNVSKIARVMSKGRTQIVRWIKRYELDVDRYRNG